MGAVGGEPVPGVSDAGAPDDPAVTVHRIPALDGVRAVAIVLVLVFHGGFSWAGGGFFGVDVFFVLSGFLITGLLVAEFRRSDGIRLARFWGHRVRRLVPALLAVLAGVALYGVFLATPDTLGQLRSDALATLFYGNNWHLMAGGTGYFADLNTPRPLLHTWSLSIEEQFYLVWPLVVVGVLRLTRSLRTLLAVSVAGAAASALAMAVLFDGGAGESRAYYGTDTRAQALLIGAALAVMLAEPLRRNRRLPRGSAPPPGGPALVRRGLHPGPAAATGLVVAGLGGLAVVLWLTATVDAATTWIYDGGFAMVALATAAVVASVALVPTSPLARALSLRPVRYVGAISYGLYLWHWPLFVVLDSDRVGLTGWPLFLVRVAATSAVSVASYHLLELPVRRGVLRGWRGWAATPATVGGVAALVLTSTAGAAPALSAQLPSTGTPAPVTVPATAPVMAPTTTDAAQQLADTGPVSTAASAGATGLVRLLLVGDSEASFMGFGLGPAATAHGVDYVGDGVFGCGLVQHTTLFHGTLVSQAQGERAGQVMVPCADQWARWTADVAADHPDVVLLEDGEYEVRNQRIGGRWVHIGQPAFDSLEVAALERSVAVLRSGGATVVLLTAPYYHQQTQLDGTPWPEDAQARVDRYNTLLRRVAAHEGPGVVVEDLGQRLDPGGHYDQTVDGVDVRYADGIHISPAGAALVAPWLLDEVVRLAQAGQTAQAGPTAQAVRTGPAAGSS